MKIYLVNNKNNKKCEKHEFRQLTTVFETYSSGKEKRLSEEIV